MPTSTAAEHTAITLPPMPEPPRFTPTPEHRQLGAEVLAECQRLHDIAQRIAPERLKELVAEDIKAAGDDPDALLRLSPLIVASETAVSRNAHAKAARSIVKSRIRDEAERTRPLRIAAARHEVEVAEQMLSAYTKAEREARALVGADTSEPGPVELRLTHRRDALLDRLSQWTSGELKVQWGELASLIG